MRIGMEFWRNVKRKTLVYLPIIVLLQTSNALINDESSLVNSSSTSEEVELFPRLYLFELLDSLFVEDVSGSSIVNGEIVLWNEELNNLIDDRCIKMSEETKRKRTDFVREALAQPQYSKMREHLAELRSKAFETPVEPVPDRIANAVNEMKQVDRSGDTNVIHDVPSVKAINSDIADLLIGGDMMLSNGVMEEHDAETLSNINPAKERRKRRRRKRQLQTAWYRKWSRDSSISYFFDYSIDDNTRRLIRLAAQYWTNNTCMTFVENAQTRPSVRFFKGQGCYSDVGRARLARQSVSIGAGCELFGTIAHELGHVLGMFHHQSRTDRDNYVTLMLDTISPYWRAQYAKEFASQNLDIEYDLGSIMHYSGYKPHTDTIEMAANDKRYQHTMGNNYGPIFTDLVLINKYYSCHGASSGEVCSLPRSHLTDRCPNGANCQNGGFRNSRNCDVCICPNGFGSADCSQRAPGEGGAPDGCGETVEAESEWKTLSGEVMPGPLPSGKNLSDLSAGCHFHIKSPDNMQIEVEVLSMAGTCSPDCYFGALEIKFNNMIKGGVRLCCESHKIDISVLKSSSNLVIASLYTQREKREFSLRYRILETEASTQPTTNTPTQATASSPLRSTIEDSMAPSETTTSSTTTTTTTTLNTCVDSGGFLCFARGVRFRCRFRRQTRQLCRRTCGLC